MPDAPTKAQNEAQPTPIADREREVADSQPVEANTLDQRPQPIEGSPSEIVDAHRTERLVEDMADEID